MKLGAVGFKVQGFGGVGFRACRSWFLCTYSGTVAWIVSVLPLLHITVSKDAVEDIRLA